MQAHIHLDQSAATAFFGPEGPDGPITMLNLLRFRDNADYGPFPELAPEVPISGRRAYALYSENTLPLLQAAGGEVVMAGPAHGFLIGPPEPRWDHVLVVRYPSKDVFRSFTSNPEYLAGVGHRTAALADSRLLPITADHSF